jgi:hypothetical protein
MHGARFFTTSAGFNTSLERRFDLLNPYVTRPRNEDRPRLETGPTLTMARPDGATQDAKCLNSGRANDNALWKTEKDPYDQDYRTQKNAALIAEKLCEGCPIKDWCLAEAMSAEGDVNGRNRYGVRGGMTPNQRAELALSRRVCARGHQGKMRQYDDGPKCLTCKIENEAARQARLRGEADGDAA